MKTKTHKAWTLLEVLVVIAIITILTSVSLAYLSSIRPNARLKAAQRELASAIRQAQSYALEGRMIGGSAKSSFGVYFINDKEYRIIWGNDKDNIIEKVILSGGVTLTFSSAVSSIEFQVPSGTVQLYPTNTFPLIITLTDPSGPTAEVEVTAGGTVEEN